MTKKIFVICLVVLLITSFFSASYANPSSNETGLSRLDVKHKLFLNDSDTLFSSFLSQQKTLEMVDKAPIQSTHESITSNVYNRNNKENSYFHIKEIYTHQKSIVMLKIYDSEHNLFGLGSGFLASADGKVITNYHVIAASKEYEISGYDVLSDLSRIEIITSDGKTHEVKDVLATDKNLDAAVVKIENTNNLPFLTLADSNTIEAGDFVVAIGCPLGIQNTISTGIISNCTNLSEYLNNNDSDNNHELKNTEFIQISAPISPGSSGGALFNMNGEVIGVTSASMVDGQNMNFAIPINKIKPMLEKFNDSSNSINYTKIFNYLNNTCSSIQVSKQKVNILKVEVLPNYLKKDTIALSFKVNETEFKESMILSIVESTNDTKNNLKNFMDLVHSKIEQLSPNKVILSKLTFEGSIKNIDSSLFSKYGINTKGAEKDIPKDIFFGWLVKDNCYNVKFDLFYSSFKEGATNYKWWNDCYLFWWWW